MTDPRELQHLILRDGQVVSRLGDLRGIIDQDVRLLRDTAHPLDRHLLSDAEGYFSAIPLTDERPMLLIDLYRHLPHTPPVHPFPTFLHLPRGSRSPGSLAPIDRERSELFRPGSGAAVDGERSFGSHSFANDTG